MESSQTVIENIKAQINELERREAIQPLDLIDRLSLSSLRRILRQHQREEQRTN